MDDTSGRPRAAKYQAYVLRLWSETGPANAAWRFSLEDVQTGKRRGFADLESLVAFLAGQLERDETD